MAKAARSRLTEVRVRTATAGDAKHGRQLLDGLGSNGLYLHVTPAGAKCWVQQLMVPDAATGKSRRVRIGLGAWPRVTLAEARKAAFANRCLRDEGRDPLAAKRQRAHETAKEARVPTFASAIVEVLALRRPTWKDADTLAGQFRASLERYDRRARTPSRMSRIATADVDAGAQPRTGILGPGRSPTPLADASAPCSKCGDRAGLREDVHRHGEGGAVVLQRGGGSGGGVAARPRGDLQDALALRHSGLLGTYSALSSRSDFMSSTFS